MRKGDGKYYTQTVHIMDGDASISTTKNSNGNWYFRKWLDDEKRMYERSLRTKDLDTARDRAKKEYIDLMSDRSKGRKVFGSRFEDVIREFVQWTKERSDSELITQARYVTIRSQCKNITEFIRHKHEASKITIGSIKVGDFYDYPIWRQRTRPQTQKVTIRNEMTTIGQFMKWCFRQSYTSFEKCDLPEMKIQEVKRRDSFTLEEYNKITGYMRSKEWLDKDKDEGVYSPNMKPYSKRNIFRHLVLASANNGMRVGEIVQLKWKMVTVVPDKQGKEPFVRIEIPKEISKVRKSRTILTRGGEYFERLKEISNFLEPEDYVFCDNYKGTMLSKTDRHRMWHDLMKGCGPLDYKGRITFYSLRHWYITARLYSGVSVYDIAKECGTSVNLIEKHYEHMDPEKLKSNARKSFKVVDSEHVRVERGAQTN
jgi:integrase